MTQENRKYEVILGAENVLSRVMVPVTAGSDYDAIVRAGVDVTRAPSSYPMDRGYGDWKVVSVTEVKPTLKELQEAMLAAGDDVRRGDGFTPRVGDLRIAFEAWLSKLQEP